jgi:8-oxo-dGTP diphosphatase
MPSVSGIIRDSSGRVLLVQQRDDGVWSTPGGSIEPDESPADAVVREVWEETGLFVVPKRVIAVFGGATFVVRYPNGDETQYISTMFECDVASGEARADGDEIERVSFWSRSEVDDLPLAPWLRGVLPRFSTRPPDHGSSRRRGVRPSGARRLESSSNARGVVHGSPDTILSITEA